MPELNQKPAEYSNEARDLVHYRPAVPRGSVGKTL